MRSVVALLALLVGLGVACGEEAEELSGPEQYAREKRQFAQLFCTCSEEETEVQPANSPCVRSYLGSQSQCEQNVLEEQWSELRPSGECLRESFEDGTDCLARSCDIEGCLARLQNASELCPRDAREAFDACNDQ